MIELNGKYTNAKIFNDYVEDEAISQVLDIINCEAFEGQTVRCMPDIHSGKGITIGFCGTLGDYVCPSHVGVDIGCTISCTLYDNPLPKDKYEEFNHKVLNEIGFGFDLSPNYAYSDRDLYDFLTKECNRAKSAHPELFYNLPDKVTQEWITGFCKRINIREKVFYASINSVGGGNHFVEYSENEELNKYGITVHCGSRNLGKRVCEYWEGLAETGLSKKEVRDLTYSFKEEYEKTHDNMKSFKEDLTAFIDSKKVGLIKGYLSGEKMHGYFCDMLIAMAYAKFNHLVIHNTINKFVGRYGMTPTGRIVSTHNYIDFSGETPIIRKGAIRAFKDEEMIVPFNMRDGIAICEGKSNEEWLCSCAHGAGRKMSRSKAKELLSMDEFTETMKDVYSTTVCMETLDEAPMAYKDTEEIKNLIKDTCDIKYMLYPKVNIKATK